jgi:hypothetical protein
MKMTARSLTEFYLNLTLGSNEVATAYNSTNHDTPFVDKDYCGRSIVFAARELVV